MTAQKVESGLLQITTKSLVPGKKHVNLSRTSQYHMRRHCRKAYGFLWETCHALATKNIWQNHPHLASGERFLWLFFTLISKLFHVSIRTNIPMFPWVHPFLWCPTPVIDNWKKIQTLQACWLVTMSSQNDSYGRIIYPPMKSRPRQISGSMVVNPFHLNPSWNLLPFHERPRTRIR